MMCATYGNFDDVMREALEAAGIKDSRREVSQRLGVIATRHYVDIWDKKTKASFAKYTNGR